jgi:hypothetical protein
VLTVARLGIPRGTPTEFFVDPKRSTFDDEFRASWRGFEVLNR